VKRTHFVAFLVTLWRIAAVWFVAAIVFTLAALEGEWAEAVAVSGSLAAIVILAYLVYQAQARTALRLEQSEERYRTVADFTHDWEYWIGPQGQVEYTSPSCEQVTGYTADEFRRDPGLLEAIVHPDDRERVAPHIREVMEHVSEAAFDFRIVRRDGQVRWLSHVCQPVYGAHQRLLGQRASNRDITDRKRIEEELAREATLNASLARLSESLLASETIQEIADYTLAVAQQLTGSPFGFVGYIDLETGHLVSPTLTRDIWVQCEMADKQTVFERFTGVWGWVLEHRLPLLTNDPEHDPRSSGTPAGHIPIRRFLAVPALHGAQLVGEIALANAPRDYTPDDQVMLERIVAVFALGVRRVQALGLLRESEERYRHLLTQEQQLSAELEQRVAERTQALEAANERLTEVDRLKSQFVSDVSHELRTPIANLKLYVDLLNHGQPERRDHYRMVLKEQAERLARIVEEILDLSRLEFGLPRKVEFGPVNLNTVVEQVIEAHRPRAERAAVALVFEAAADLPQVRGEKNQLMQVATNLIDNALNYTPAGEVEVTTGWNANEGYLEVRDTGIGIDPEDLPNLFQRFYRGRRAQEHQIPGTGLGLAIVKEIVDLHDGHISVESAPGQGTIFRVWLHLLNGAETHP
jgi:PAS domain S-box-containing protein